jgi:excisionase family DNA binding protein
MSDKVDNGHREYRNCARACGYGRCNHSEIVKMYEVDCPENILRDGHGIVSVLLDPIAYCETCEYHIRESEIRYGDNRNTLSKSNGKDFLTARELARLLNVHINTVRRWDNEGLLKSYRLGRGKHRRFPREDVKNFLDNGGNGNKPNEVCGEKVAAQC